MNEKSLLAFEERGAITVGQINIASVLDAANVAQFGNELMAYVTCRNNLNLLLDFSKVTYLSSAVLTELLRVNKAISANGGEFKLCGLNSNIHKVFEITNLDRVFTIYESVEDGIKKFKRSLAIEEDEDSWDRISKGL